MSICGHKWNIPLQSPKIKYSGNIWRLTTAEVKKKWSADFNHIKVLLLIRKSGILLVDPRNPVRRVRFASGLGWRFSDQLVRVKKFFGPEFLAPPPGFYKFQESPGSTYSLLIFGGYLCLLVYFCCLLISTSKRDYWGLAGLFSCGWLRGCFAWHGNPRPFAKCWIRTAKLDHLWPSDFVSRFESSRHLHYLDLNPTDSQFGEFLRYSNERLKSRLLNIFWIFW